MCGRLRIGGVCRIGGDEYIPVQSAYLFWFWVCLMVMAETMQQSTQIIKIRHAYPRTRCPDDSDLAIGYSTTVASEGLEDSECGNL